MNLNFIEAKIDDFYIHRVGNKLADEGLSLSKKAIAVNSDLKNLFVHYFVSPFKSNECFNFFHNIDLSMNEVFVCANNIFANKDHLYNQSINLAKHLYEQSTHPKIKNGEFYVVYFEHCIIDGEIVDAIGLFKSENKDTFIKIFPIGSEFEVESEQGININKLDKGCLIFNTEREKGYAVAVVDNTNKGAEAQYWMDDFLHIRQRKDEYYKTQNILSLYKNFVKSELPQHFEVSKIDQADLLNKSIKFLKENDKFNIAEFANEVIGQPKIIESFNQYKARFQEDYDVEIADNFAISESAIKKQARSLKSIIKLDKNFHIYIHGSRELLEQGEDKKGKFYKVYYKEES